MKTKRHKHRDPFADESTVRYDPSVPIFVEDDDTRPVDVDEMADAARRSRHVVDPSEPPQLAAAVSMAGGPAVMLPVYRLSPTGVALVIPPGVALALADDMPVAVELRGAHVAALVVHHRAPRDDAPGGLSLRWDTRDPNSARELAALLRTT